MQISLSSAAALELIRNAEEYYSGKLGVGVSIRIRIQAMRRFAEFTRKKNPKATITLTLEDHMLLTELP
jgi:hypothetical protein